MFGTSFSDYLGGASVGDDYDPSDPLGLRKSRTRKLYPGGPPVGGSTTRTPPLSANFPYSTSDSEEPPNSSPPKDRPGDDEDGRQGPPGGLSRSSRGLALMNLGLGIASGAGGDYAGGLVRGIAGFTNTVQGERAAAVAEAAQKRKDERQAKLDALEARSKEATIAHVGAETTALGDTRAHNLTTWQNEEQKRGNTGAAGHDMVAAIEASAGKDSPEASQARALASLGEDVDLARLANQHDKVIERSHLGGDAAAKLQGEIPGLQAQITAGVREDPKEAAARKRQELGYEGQRVVLEGRKVSAYETQTSKQANRDPSPQQISQAIAAETERIFAPVKKQLDARVADPLGIINNKVDPKTGKQLYDKQGKALSLPPVTQADYDRERHAAYKKAVQNVIERNAAVKGAVAPGAYGYDHSTGQMTDPAGNP